MKQKNKKEDFIACYLVHYKDSFGVEHIPKETEEFMGNKNITLSIYRIQDTSQ